MCLRLITAVAIGLLPLFVTSVLADPRPISGTHLIPRSAPPYEALPKRQTSPRFEVGDTLTVRAFSFQLIGGGHYMTTTTCRLVGQNCYLFVEDEVWGSSRVTETRLATLAAAFDNTTPADGTKGIFNTNRALFGTPPDVDGDPRVLIALLDILDSPFTGVTIVGYFDADNQAPPISRELLYLDVNPLDIEDSLAPATLAHEFQHMIHWAADPDEDKWLDEGCSEYAELACGYKDTTEAVATAFLDVPNTSLTVWEDLPFNFDQAFLYTTYFAQRFGDEAIAQLVALESNGVASVDEVLAARGERSRFKDLFADWATALYLDGPGAAGLERVDLRNVARAAIDLPASNVSRNARLWGTDYLDLSGSFDGLTVSLGSNGDNPVLAVLIDAEGGSFIEVAPSKAITVNVYAPSLAAMAVVSTDGTTESYTVSLTPTNAGTEKAASDFDGDGTVGFPDFLQFARQFGRNGRAEGFDPSFDLNGNRSVDFTDFLIFATRFGE